ncbi:MAG: pilin N-terminal domain-containing protein [Anaerococcus sp.]|nr:pilin N-terminal domain-containing protein [Anaerococcus sp.]
MKKLLRKLAAAATALAMFAGAAAPAMAQAGTPVVGTLDTETITTVTLHKIKVNSLDGFPITQQDGADVIVGKDGTTEYNGGVIQDLTGFFGTGAQEIAGVEFTYWVFDNQAAYEAMVNAPDSYDTVDEVNTYLTEQNVTATQSTAKSAIGGVALDQIIVPANENRFLWAVESSSVIAGENGAEDQTITGMKAVPFGLALPLLKADGSANTDIHVYPKNTTANEPKVDKDHAASLGGAVDANNDRQEITNEIPPVALNVGDEVPYEIETLIPAGVNYETARWSDQMTEGLTFGQTQLDGLTVKIGAKGAEVALVKDTDYTVSLDGNGFILDLLAPGLAQINNQTSETRVFIEYKAILDEDAVVERPERNDLMFHYGNKQEHANTPKPTKPSNGSLTVTKNFPNVNGGWAVGETVTVTIYDAHTGQPVVFEDGTLATQTLDIDNQSFTWNGLDNDRQYIVKEQFNVGHEAEYITNADGSITINDYLGDFPGPIDPEEPSVETYGHRFQKVDQAGTGLPGAEFVVKNNIAGDVNNGKYLALKSGTQLQDEQAAYDAAEKAYKDAVSAATQADPNTAGIANLKATRDKAFADVNYQWTWVDTKDAAYKVTSGDNGFFKIGGLKDGAYQLEETKAPDGFAMLTAPVDFEVTKDSMGETTMVDTKLTDTGLTSVENKKVTIPQTGGIGTMIFTIVGIGLMAGAYIAMKRNKEIA